MEQTATHLQTVERRAKQRVECFYPAIVQGKDINDKKFRTNATLINISASGLCVLFKTDTQPGGELFVLFRYSSTGPLGKSKAPLIAVDGALQWSRKTRLGMSEFGIKIRHNRFL
ncbi:MAG: PilZ domain-containing protein [Chloroflexi bacterium]|nr:PilZ domain-containing protein [Chloroflexota bacterium]